MHNEKNIKTFSAYVPLINIPDHTLLIEAVIGFSTDVMLIILSCFRFVYFIYSREIVGVVT
jgi:hypothetical protein